MTVPSAAFSLVEFARLLPQLRNWHENGYVSYPWRKGEPGNRPPYRVWVAEVMAQQTRVATIVPYFESWMHSFPSLRDVAQSSDQDVLKAWEGLGYYRRALNLHKTACLIMERHGGEFPSTKEELLALPGIGRYTAGAILSLCFDQPEPAVDANVVRLFSRLLNKRLTQSRRKDVDEIESILRETLQSSSSLPAGMLAESLMVLGSRVCRPRTPKCQECPLSPACLAFKKGAQTAIVGNTLNKPLPVKSFIGLYLRCQSASDVLVLLVQHKHAEMLGGLWGFPALQVPDPDSFDYKEVADLAKLTWNLEVRDIGEGVPLTQDYSHFQRRQRALHASGSPKQPENGEWANSRWVPESEIQDFPMSVIDQKMAKAFLQETK